MAGSENKYKSDGTKLGFKTVKVFSATEAASPPQASCKMNKPA